MTITKNGERIVCVSFQRQGMTGRFNQVADERFATHVSAVIENVNTHESGQLEHLPIDSALGQQLLLDFFGEDRRPHFIA